MGELSAQHEQGASSGIGGSRFAAGETEAEHPSNRAVKQTALDGGILVKTKRVAVGAAAYGWRWKETAER